LRVHSLSFLLFSPFSLIFAFCGTRLSRHCATPRCAGCVFALCMPARRLHCCRPSIPLYLHPVSMRLEGGSLMPRLMPLLRASHWDAAAHTRTAVPCWLPGKRDVTTHLHRPHHLPYLLCPPHCRASCHTNATPTLHFSTLPAVATSRLLLPSSPRRSSVNDILGLLPPPSPRACHTSATTTYHGERVSGRFAALGELVGSPTSSFRSIPFRRCRTLTTAAAFSYAQTRMRATCARTYANGIIPSPVATILLLRPTLFFHAVLEKTPSYSISYDMATITLWTTGHVNSRLDNDVFWIATKLTDYRPRTRVCWPRSPVIVGAVTVVIVTCFAFICLPLHSGNPSFSGTHLLDVAARC